MSGAILASLDGAVSLFSQKPRRKSKSFVAVELRQITYLNQSKRRIKQQDQKEYERRMYQSTSLRTLCSWRVMIGLVSVFLWTCPVLAQPSITTQMYDNHHDGWNPNETTLTVANVKSGFQLLFKDTTDDGTYAQPLYVPGLSIAGGTHNVIFVATENNTVYAFDADSQGAPLWSVNLTPSGETLQNMNDYANTRIPHMGISGTPVIDPSS